MRTARIIIIGGGIVGCSVLYHLAKAGCKDALLIERAELTAGATWHAAGNVHNQNPVPNLSTLQAYSMRLYDGLTAEVGQEVGAHIVGGFFLAQTRQRMAEFTFLAGKFAGLGLPYELVSPAQIKARFPLINTDGLRGGAWDPDEGYVDPYSVTMGLAAAARQMGARIVRHCRVTAISRRRGEGWRLTTVGGDGVGDGGDESEYECEVVVNAAGFWGDEVAAMVGARLPVVNMEHQYVVTEAMPAVAACADELPLLRDMDAQFYLRQEGDALLLGAWEDDCRAAWGGAGAPWDFGQELFTPDLARMERQLAAVYHRVPALAEAGVKRVVNGAISFSPDGRGLLGPLPGVPDFFVACGFLSGITQAGGVGLALAQWILEGETELDLACMDVARFGRWAGRSFARARVADIFPRRYEILYPQLERGSGRPLRKTPIYARLRAAGAVMGEVGGWERPLWFGGGGGVGDAAGTGDATDHGHATAADHPTDSPSFTHPNWWHPVGAEARATATAAALYELTTYARWRVHGRAAAAYLHRLTPSRLPPVGRLGLALMLNHRGGILGDFIVTRLAADDFHLTAASTAEGIHHRWLADHQGDYEVTVRCVTAETAALGIFGPASRRLLATLSATFADADFAYLHWREVTLGGARCHALRLSYAGELGYEIHCAATDQPAIYDAIVVAGGTQLRLAGSRALTHLRLEKGYRSWGAELTPEITPAMAGLARLCHPEAPEKAECIGRDALLRAQGETPAKSLATLQFDAPTVAGCWGAEPVFYDGEWGVGEGGDGGIAGAAGVGVNSGGVDGAGGVGGVGEGASTSAADNCVGYITSGGYGWRIGAHLAVALLPTPLCAPGTTLRLQIMGESCAATVVADPVYDPQNTALRGPARVSPVSPPPVP